MQGSFKEEELEPVHPDFINKQLSTYHYFGNICHESLCMLKECPDITSGTRTVCVVSQESEPTWESIIITSATYTFHLEPEQPCNRASKCGFLIEITGTSKEDPKRFDVKLVLDNEKYPDNLHISMMMSVQIGCIWTRSNKSGCKWPLFKQQNMLFFTFFALECLKAHETSSYFRIVSVVS